MKEKIRFLSSGLVFLALLGLILVPLQQVLARKSLTGPWDMTNKVGAGHIRMPGMGHSVHAFFQPHTGGTAFQQKRRVVGQEAPRIL